MNQRWKIAPALVLWAMLEACGASVSAQGDGGGSNDGGSGAACTLPTGGSCPVGTSCPAGDGCNTCSCIAGQPPRLACTLIACIDAGPPGCRSGAECANGQECVFETSSCGGTGRCEGLTPCAMPMTYCSCTGVSYDACRPNQPTRFEGRCEAPAQACNARTTCPADRECVYPVGACGVDGRCSPISDCAEIAQFCGCDGSTFRGCQSRPTRPAMSEGACPGVADAGAGACAGAGLNAQGACVFAGGSSAPVACCSGYNCDARTALCESLPPTCEGGSVPTVVGACWGPCVPRALCR